MATREKKPGVPRVKTGRIIVTSGPNKGKKYPSVAAAKKAAAPGSKVSYKRVSVAKSEKAQKRRSQRAATNPNVAKRMAKRKAKRMSGGGKVSKIVKSLRKK